MLGLKINNQSQSRAVIVAGELGYYDSRQLLQQFRTEQVHLHRTIL